MKKDLQQSRLVKYLSSYLAFVFIVLQVVDIISEPFSFSENLIVYLVYFFAFILVFVVLAAIKSDKKTNRLEKVRGMFANSRGNSGKILSPEVDFSPDGTEHRRYSLFEMRIQTSHHT